MKLIFCDVCHDVVKLSHHRRSCRCLASWGRYFEDGLHATIGGAAVGIAIDNLTFSEAYKADRSPGSPMQPRDFKGWFFGDDTPTLTRE